MAYCKHCPCGHVMIYEHPSGSPLFCPKCTRLTASWDEMPYSPPTAEEEPVQDSPPLQPETDVSSDPPSRFKPVPLPQSRFLITVESPDGELVIPVREKLVVGRNAAGKEYLGQFPDVTRDHFTIAPRANGITATLTDHGRWGTYVNGTRMMKESSVVVSNFSEIRLASKAILIVRVQEVNADA